MGRFYYLKAGHWGLFTEQTNQDLSKLWSKFLRDPNRTSCLKFLRAYKRFCIKIPEAADAAVREVVHFRTQVVCEEHGLPMDELWNAIIKENHRGKDEEDCWGK